jgi:hypothetical protein
MKKIQTAHVKIYRAEGHCEFMIVTRDLIVKSPAVQALVLSLYGEFVILIDREEKLINLMQKSDYTKKIADADHRVDRALVGMKGLTVAVLHHIDPTTAEAARSLLNRINAFGNIARKSYEEETLDVNLLISDLQSDEYASKADAIGLTSWIQELRAAESAFELLLERRNAETSRKPQGRIRDARRETDTVYRRIVDRIDAAATLDDDPNAIYDTFIAELNARITYFNNHTHQHARRDISVGETCVIESIADQIYTGKAITPLPRAYYREEGHPTEELVFARDYTVTYKNNLVVGMADLILHGKGAYKGQKKTTFNISRTV